MSQKVSHDLGDEQEVDRSIHQFFSSIQRRHNEEQPVLVFDLYNLQPMKEDEGILLPPQLFKDDNSISVAAEEKVAVLRRCVNRRLEFRVARDFSSEEFPLDFDSIKAHRESQGWFEIEPDASTLETIHRYHAEIDYRVNLDMAAQVSFPFGPYYPTPPPLLSFHVPHMVTTWEVKDDSVPPRIATLVKTDFDGVVSSVIEYPDMSNATPKDPLTGEIGEVRSTPEGGMDLASEAVSVGETSEETQVETLAREGVEAQPPRPKKKRKPRKPRISFQCCCGVSQDSHSPTYRSVSSHHEYTYL